MSLSHPLVFIYFKSEWLVCETLLIREAGVFSSQNKLEPGMLLTLHSLKSERPVVYSSLLHPPPALPRDS